MAQSDHPYLYTATRSEAVRLQDTELWEKSFRENVACARAIEKALRWQCGDDDVIRPDCAAGVLEEYGFKRVNFVLASTVLDLQDVPVVRQSISDETLEWARETCPVLDKEHCRYFTVDTATGLLDQFIRQTHEAYAALGLFDRNQCSAGMYEKNVQGRVLIMKPSTLKESCWSPQDQLWLAENGFGCDPKSSGRAIYARCLGDGEQARWNREDFLGVLDEQFLPDWAEPRLAELRGQKQNMGMTMSGL